MVRILYSSLYKNLLQKRPSIYNENFEYNLSLDLIKKIKIDGIKNMYLTHPYLRNPNNVTIDNSDLLLKRRQI